MASGWCVVNGSDCAMAAGRYDLCLGVVLGCLLTIVFFFRTDLTAIRKASLSSSAPPAAPTGAGARVSNLPPETEARLFEEFQFEPPGPGRMNGQPLRPGRPYGPLVRRQRVCDDRSVSFETVVRAARKENAVHGTGGHVHAVLADKSYIPVLQRHIRRLKAMNIVPVVAPLDRETYTAVREMGLLASCETYAINETGPCVGE
jgi:hypothetical protein